MKDRDKYWKKAKKEGYRARSAYKLKQINNRFNLIKKGDNVLDIGAAPGGWLQVTKEINEGEGKIIGVDRQTIDSIEGVNTIKGDITNEKTIKQIESLVDDIDVVISDVAPDLSGNWSIDHAKSIDLAKKTLKITKDVLSPGGNYLVKVFQGKMYSDFIEKVEQNFKFTKGHRPKASRDQSAEIYVIAKGFNKKPIEEGDTYEVEIIDKGREGDGVAKIDDFVIFVPEAEKGDKIKIKITEIRDNYSKGRII